VAKADALEQRAEAALAACDHALQTLDGGDAEG
jgi:hypothetical protein